MLSQKNRERFWVLYFGFAFFWALQAFALLGQWMHDKELQARKIDGRPYISDFVSFYGSGVLARQCLTKPTKIYDGPTQIELETKLTAPVVPEAPFSNPNTPVTFVVLLPLSLLTLDGAWITWGLVTLLASIGILLATFVKPLRHWFAKLTAVTAFAASYATWFSIRLGSTSCLLFPMVLSFFYFLKGGNLIATAAMACIGTIKLQYAPYLLSIGTARFGWKFPAVLAGFCAILLGICTAVLGWDNIVAFPQAFLTNEASSQIVGVQPEKMQNLRGILVLITGSDSKPIHYLSAGVCLTAAGCLFFIWKKLDWKDSVRFNLLASATVLLMLVSSPHTHTQDYILAFIPCLLLFLAADRNDTNIGTRDRLILKIAAVSFVYLSWILFFLDFLFRLCKIQPFALWAAVVAAYVLRLYFTTASTAPNESSNAGAI
ncbi:MAG: hypothetical protein C0507_03065 [Cyanobacteria bacterium PR.3.49]|nr:hypothetical protein [Cyanobacteria bacterium PR.3.49]